MADAAAPKWYTRRTFLGWWIASLLTATIVTALPAPLLLLWPAAPKGQKKGLLRVPLATSITDLQDGDAIKFDAPTSPNSAFVMADGGGDNAAGDLRFGGLLVNNTGKREG